MTYLDCKHRAAEMIPVTKSFLPPLEEYTAQVQRAFHNQWLTNRGELVLELEKKIADYLSLEESKMFITNNGTIPLQIALKLLGQQGEIITTPFSYVATTASIVWENCTPVFVDIDPKHLTIDESLIEEKITPKTTAILATHVFGHPCNINYIDALAKKYGLKVIYDAAHCFGVQYQGRSIFEYGDVSTCSFHATKLFHTGEGGAIFTKQQGLYDQLYYSHNFGHNGPLHFHGLGINGKISELQAAMGLAVLPYLPTIIAQRKKWVATYNELLQFRHFEQPTPRENTDWNYAYYPIVFESEALLLEVMAALEKNAIYPRRYFYPSLNQLPYLPDCAMPLSDSIATRILCLPLYAELQQNEVEQIADIINKCLSPANE
ncbi:MAG: DegT/DnrJ/EryC1/StrS family aminotransferase [Bacteroidota bacterium]